VSNDNRHSDLRAKLLEYLSGDRKGKSANDFEQAELDDPFLAEATEGYEQLSSDQIASDLDQLDQRLATKTRAKSWTMAIAASVGLLIAGSITIWLVISSGEVTQERLSQSEPKVEIEAEKFEELVKEVPMTTDEQDQEGKEFNRQDQSEMIAIESVEDQQGETSTSSRPVVAQKGVSIDDSIIEEPVEIDFEEPIITESIVLSDMDDTEVPTDLEEDLFSGLAETESDDFGVSADEIVQELAPVKVSTSKAARSISSLSSNLVSGQITDEDGLGIPGVTVVEKGTTNGTISDIDGNYKIELKGDVNPVLSYSFIGYDSKEIEPKGATENVQLSPDVQSLSEVVVVGYGSGERTITTELEEYSYEEARPEGGRKAFEVFIESNKSAEETGKVVLLVFLNANGAIDRVEVKRSGGVSLDQEAIRLIKEYPAWIPAQRNGEVVESKLRVKIRF
jgi:TonB family protein